MILSDSTLEERYVKTGTWGRVTLDSLLARAAKRSPDKVALISETNDGNVRTHTFAELNSKVDALADFFFEAGLRHDNTVVMQMEPSSEAVMTYLALLRAGLVAVPIPVTWGTKDMVRALNALSPRALIAGNHSGNSQNINTLYDLASELFSVRMVGGFGSNLPDGAVDLDTMLRSFSGKSYKVNREGNSAMHIASVQFMTSTDGEYIPVARSHNHWIASGLMHLIEGRFSADSRIISTYHLSGVTGISAVLVPWLLTQCTLGMGRFEDLDNLARFAHLIEATHGIIPDGLAQSYLDRLETLGNPLSTLSIVSGIRGASETISDNDRTHIVPVRLIHGLAAVPLQKTQDNGTLPLGAQKFPYGSGTTPPFMTTRIKTSSQSGSSLLGGELVLQGPAIPDKAWPASRSEGGLKFDDKGGVRTGIGCRVAGAENDSLELLGFLGDINEVGNSVVSLNAINDVFKAHPDLEDAAAFIEEDTLLGHRIRLAIVPKTDKNISLDTIRSFCTNANLSQHLLPTAVVSVDRIPRGSSGTVQIARLEAEARSSAA
jgi:mycobactin salicyl-AMP ligase